MEKTYRSVPALYGYGVCLVSIIVGLIAISSIVNSAYKLQDPLRSNDYTFGVDNHNLSSFEGYKIDVLNSNVVDGKTVAPAYTPTDAELRSAYNAAKEDRTASVRLNARGTITNSVIMLVLAVLLFLTHWSWMNRLNKKANE